MEKKQDNEVNLRIPRTNRTPTMLTKSTLGPPPHKYRLALVTRPPYPLRRRLSHKILCSRCLSRNCQNNRRSGHRHLLSIPNARNCLVPHLLSHGSHDWEPWALFASGVLATLAHPFRTKGLFAPMALSMHTHANLLLHALAVNVVDRSPVARFQGKIVLCKKGTYLVFLRGIGGGSGCVWWTATELWSWRGSHDEFGCGTVLLS